MLVALAVLAVALVALRLRLIGGIDTTVAVDEVGYISSARFLAGGYADAVLTGTFYSVGSSLLLVPVAALWSSPTSQHVAGVVLNVVLVSALLAPLYVLLRRHLGATPLSAFGGAAVAGTIPWVTTNAATLWAETSLAVLVVLWLLGVGSLRPGSRAGPVGLALASVALYAVHPRMIGMMAMGALLLVGAAVVRRIDLGTAALAAAAFAGSLVLTRWLNGLVVDGLYLVSGSSVSGGVLQRFEPQDLGSYLDSAIGQSWGVMVSTFGLVVPGTWFVASRAWAGRRRLRTDRAADGAADDISDGSVDPLVAVAVLASLAWVGAVTTLQIGSGIGRLSRGVALTPRGDLLVYTRYVEPVALVLVAVGVHWLLDHRTARRERMVVGAGTLALLGVLTLWVRAAFPLEWFSSFFSPSNASVVFAWIQRVDTFSPLRIALPVAVLLAALTLLPRTGRRLAVVAAVVVSLALTHTGVEQHLRPFRDYAHAHHEVATAIAAAEGIDEVAVLAPWDSAAFYTYQFWLTDVSYRLVTEDALPDDLRLVVAPIDWPGATAAGATMVASDPDLATALWSLDGVAGEPAP